MLMKQITKTIGSLLIILISFSSCKNDFDLNADYQRQPVVYGVLDPSMDNQIFIVNHTFLGDGSAFDYAQVQDSSNYENVSAYITWNDGNNSVELMPTIIDDKDVDGVFFAPEQLVYQAPTSDFDFDGSERVYSLKAMADGDSIFSSTDVTYIKASDVLTPPTSIPLSFVSTQSQPYDPIYRSATIQFLTVKNALSHKVSIRLSYDEHYINGETTPVTTEFFIKSLKAGDEDGGDQIEFNYNGESFYQTVKNTVNEDDNVDYRSITGLDFVFYAFGTDMSNYIEIVNPTTGVGQATPSFSNINNGEGHGIFSARSQYVRILEMSGKTIQELVEGDYTSALGFCFPQEGFGCQ